MSLEYGCGGAMADDGRTRLGAHKALETFRTLHRTEMAAATDPATLAAPRCPRTLPPIEYHNGPLDTIDRYGVLGGHDPPLPMPLVAATSCRYAPNDRGGGRLVDSHRDRGDLTTLREALNATFDDRTAKDSTCASAVDTMGDALPDVILVVDVTGQSAAYWVFSPAAGAPCPAAFAAPPAMRPKPGLTAYLDGAFGPVR